MRVQFKTNIDIYRNGVYFPEKLPMPPRIGEKVSVQDEFKKYFEK